MGRVDSKIVLNTEGKEIVGEQIHINPVRTNPDKPNSLLLRILGPGKSLIFEVNLPG